MLKQKLTRTIWMLLIIFTAAVLLMTACPTSPTGDEGNGESVEDEEEDTMVAVTGVTLDKNSTTIIIGSTEELTATVKPSDATDKSVSWKSDNGNVASVDSGGLVTAVADGSATIKVKTTDGGFTDTCDVTVAIWSSTQSGSASSVGSSITYTNHRDNFSFKVKACPGATFPTGVDNNGDIDDDGTQDVPPTATVSSFWAAETEATNELVASVYQWAHDKEKLSGGTVNEDTVTLYNQELLDLDLGNNQISFSDSEGTFSVDTGFEDYPCVEITWYGAILVCNWLTEIAMKLYTNGLIMVTAMEQHLTEFGRTMKQTKILRKPDFAFL